MKSIEKSSVSTANAIIDPYLHYAKSQPWYAAGDIYKDHFTRKYGKRKLIDDILLPEQDCRCCYCMKRLNPKDDPDATIEHLIPRSTLSGTPFTEYFSVAYSGLNSHNVCHTDNYKAGIALPGQYPHHVAYHNFAIACNDCNRNRGNSVIGFPCLLTPGVQHIRYNRKTGSISWFGDPKLFDGSPESEYMVNKVGLNRPILKAIRAVWLYGKDHPSANNSTPDTIHSVQERKELIYNAFGAALAADPCFGNPDMEAFLSLETEGVWQEVLKYDYFGTI